MLVPMQVDTLCDRLAILVAGRVNAEGSPDQLKPFQLLEYQMIWWVCRFDIINLGQWCPPHSAPQCTLLAETLVIIPVVTAMAEAAVWWRLQSELQAVAAVHAQ